MVKLFNNGDNNGTVVLLSGDGQIIRCHDFVFESQCAFGQAKMHFDSHISTESKWNSEINNSIQPNYSVQLNYSAKIIRLILSKMYSDKYLFSDLDLEFDDIIQF